MKENTKNGNVKWKALGEIGEIYGGITGKKKEDFKNGNKKLITYKNVYENLSLNLNFEDKVRIEENEKQRKLKYGDIIFTGSSENLKECGLSSVVTEIPNEELYLNSFCFFLRLNNNNLLLPNFSKHLFRSEILRKKIIKTASGVTRFNVSKKLMKKIQIPLPPLKKQAEIAAALDKFTELTEELTEELTKELTAREAQYEYYRNMLLSENYLNKISEKLIKEFCPGGVEWKKLGEVCEIGTGKSNTNEQSDNGKYPFYVRSKDIKRINKFEFDETSIIIPGEGGIGEIFHYVKGKYALHQRAYRIHIIDEKIITKFIYYYLMNNFKKYIMKNAVSSTITSIRKPMIENFEIPIPPIEIQNKIIDILDNFETLVNDIRQGLPREIELRQKQYEYYREKLLTFEAE